MKKLLILSLSACFGMAATAGPGKPGKLTVNIQPNATSGMGVVMHYQPKADSAGKRDIVYAAAGNQVAPVVRPLSGTGQIVFVFDEAYLVSSGESLEVNVNLQNYSHKVPRHLAPAGVLKQYAAKAMLPRLIDSLYARVDTMATRQLLDARIADNHARVEAAINAAGVSAEDRSLLQTYEAMRKLIARHGFLGFHPAESKATGIGAWSLEGFDISDPNFSKLSNTEFYASVVQCWWSGRKLAEPELEDDFKVLDLLRLAKSDILKQEFSKSWVHGEVRRFQFSPSLKRLYPMISSGIVPGAQKRFIDSVYKRFAKMDKGLPATEIVTRNEEGKIVRLSDFRGKMVVIDLWATWCSGCIANLPKFHKIAEKYKGKDDIVFLSISYELDGYEKLWKEIATKQGISGPTSLIIYRREDSKDFQRFMDGYSITGVPRYIAIDKKGNFLNNSLGGFVDLNMERMIEDYYNDQQ